MASTRFQPAGLLLEATPVEDRHDTGAETPITHDSLQTIRVPRNALEVRSQRPYA